MKKYDKIYSVMPPLETGGKYSVIESHSTRLKEHLEVIVLTEEELLDLMQESIEHSYPTLLREKAKSLLHSKL